MYDWLHTAAERYSLTFFRCSTCVLIIFHFCCILSTLLEKGSRIRLLSLTTSQQQPDPPLFPKAVRNGTDYVSDGNMNDNNAVGRWKCDVREKNEDAFECPARFKVCAIIVLLFALCSFNIILH